MRAAWAAVVATLAILAAGVYPVAGAQPAPRELLVAAAASLSGLAPALTDAYRRASGTTVRFTFAGSNTLARQIVAGARVDVFISADASQMDVVERAGRIAAGSRFDLLGNQLKLVVSTLERDLPAPFQPKHLADRRIQRVALGDPEAVPVGVYARKWLQQQGLWSAVAPKVIPLPSSPAVLAAVQAGRAEAGIVYATDGPTPAGSHVVPVNDAPAIAYPAAAVSGPGEGQARAFLAFLRQPAARDIFRAAGFTHLP